MIIAGNSNLIEKVDYLQKNRYHSEVGIRALVEAYVFQIFHCVCGRQAPVSSILECSITYQDYASLGSEYWITAVTLARYLVGQNAGRQLLIQQFLTPSYEGRDAIGQQITTASCNSLFSILVKNKLTEFCYYCNEESLFHATWKSVVKINEDIYIWVGRGVAKVFVAAEILDKLGKLLQKSYFYHIHQFSCSIPEDRAGFIDWIVQQNNLLSISQNRTDTGPPTCDFILDSPPPAEIALCDDIHPKITLLLKKIEHYASYPAAKDRPQVRRYLQDVRTSCKFTAENILMNIFRFPIEKLRELPSYCLDAISRKMDYFESNLARDEIALYMIYTLRVHSLIWKGDKRFPLPHVLIILQYQKGLQKRYLPLQSFFSMYRLIDWLQYRKSITGTSDASYSREEFLENFWNPLTTITSESINTQKGMQTYCDLFLAPTPIRIPTYAPTSTVDDLLFKGIYLHFKLE